MFSRVQGRATNVSMGAGRCEIDNDLNRRVGEHFGERPSSHHIFLPFCFGTTHIHVGTSDDIQTKGKTILYINVTDIATPYNSDSSFGCHAPVPFRLSIDNSCGRPPSYRWHNDRVPRSATRSSWR